MIPEVGEVKLGIEIFVGEDLLTEEKYDLIDKIQTSTLLSKNIASRGMNRLENQLSDSKNSQKFQLRKTELDTRNQQGQNGQQHQINQNNVAQNNKNSINSPQGERSQNNLGNKQVSRGEISNKQQEAPISKMSDINKSGVSQVAASPNYLTKAEQGGTLVIAAGNNPIEGAHNIDINENIEIGVFKGDATNLVNVPTGSQAKVIIENPFKFNPYNSEILRVLQKGGELKVTGVESNRYFNSIIEDIDKKIIKVPEGYELIEVKEIPISERKQGFQSSGRPIGKKTDIEIRLRKK